MKKTKRNKGQSFRARQQKAILFASLILLLVLAGLAGLLYWAHADLESQLAEDIRKFIGIPPAEAPVVAAEAPPPEPPPPPPEPEIVEESEPIPEPEPEPVPLEWTDFRERENLWPDQLQITYKQSFPIRYNGQTFGEMHFTPGQRVQIKNVLEENTLHGSIKGNHFLIPANCTDLNEWFAAHHGSNFHLDFPLNRPAPEREPVITMTEQSRNKILEELRQWCLINYGTMRISMEPDALVLEWAPNDDIPVAWKAEAIEVARAYLMIQEKHEGSDNFAACRIVEPETGRLLGVGSIFMPSRVEL